MATLQLEIVTPEGRTFNDAVESVVLPGSEGEMGILPQHAALLTQLKPGELRITQNGKVTELAVGEGFAEVTGEKVSVLTDMAVQESEIDEQKVQEAITRAETALKDKELGSEEIAAAEASIARSVAALNLKRKRRV
jgi:F-type H+-transporting ATPase subunit epsilon